MSNNASKTATAHSVDNHVSPAKKLVNITVNHADIFVAWLVLTLANLIYHRLIPPDETRYASVAWEMWYSRDFLVPHLNGAFYHHKPPLLFWFYDLGWSLFGVNELWLLLVSPLCALISLFLVRYLAGLLWPKQPATMSLAPWLLLGSLLWSAFLNAAMFDTLLTACVLLSITGLIKASRDLRWHSWAIFAAGCGLGLLAKGPVVFVHVLIPFLAGRWWSETVRHNQRRWYIQGGAAIIAAIVLALCWAIPAIASAGDAYGGTLLWHQTVDRVANSFAHRRPFWWYLMLSPVILFPWFFWPRAWRNIFRRKLLQDDSFRFCLIWFVSGFLVFSLISGKQVHYLLPLLPALALLLSRAFAGVQTVAKPGDSLPYLMIVSFGLILLFLPGVPGIRLYHWLQSREIWWAVFIVLIGLGGMMTIAKTRNASPYCLSLTIILVLTISLAGFFKSTGNAFHLQQAVRQLRQFQKAGDPIAWAGKYDGQFQFLLRMKEPLPVINKDTTLSWLTSHRNGHVVAVDDSTMPSSELLKIDYAQFYRESKLWIQSLRLNPGS